MHLLFPNRIHFDIQRRFTCQIVWLFLFLHRNDGTLPNFDSLIDFKLRYLHFDIAFTIFMRWMYHQRSIRMWNFHMASQMSSITTERLLIMIMAIWVYVAVVVSHQTINLLRYCLSPIFVVLSNIDNRNGILVHVLSYHFNLRILKIRYLVILLFEIGVVLDERRCSLGVIIFSTRRNFWLDQTARMF